MEKFQKIGVTAFVVSGDEKVLLLRRSKKEKFLPGYFELPGGKVDFGENPEKALERSKRGNRFRHFSKKALFLIFLDF